MAVNVEYVIKLNDQLSRKLGVVQKQVNRLNGQVNKTQSNFSKLGSLFARVGGAVAIGAAAKSIVTLGVNMEQTRISFATFLGSAEKGNAVLKELNEFANVTPFDNKQVIKAGRTLLAFGIQANELKPTLKALGDISAGTGKDLSELGVIYGQIRGAGRLMGQDLLQLINAGFNPLQKMSERTGESMLSLRKKMEKGLISFEMVSDEFKRATSEGGQFFNLMEKQSQSVGGRFSTLLGKLQLIGIELGEALLPLLGKLTDIATKFIENRALLIRIAKIVGVVAAAYIAFNSVIIIQNGLIALHTFLTGLSTTAIILNTLVTEGLSAAFVALNLAMSANPIGVVIGLIAALTAAFVVAWKTSEKFRSVILGLWGAAKSVFLNIGRLGADIFGSLGDLLAGVFTFDMEQINKGLDGIKNAVKLFGAKVAVDFNAGFAKGKKKDGTEETSLLDEAKTKSGVTGSTPTVPTGNIKAGVAGVTASAPKTFNINIDSLIKDFDINTTNLQESGTRVKDEVTKALLTALTNTSIISE